MLGAPTVCTNIEGWSTHETQKSKEGCMEICILLCRYAGQYNLGYSHTAMPTVKLASSQRSSGISAWNAPWVQVGFS